MRFTSRCKSSSLLEILEERTQAEVTYWKRKGRRRENRRWQIGQKTRRNRWSWKKGRENNNNNANSGRKHKADRWGDSVLPEGMENENKTENKTKKGGHNLGKRTAADGFNCFSTYLRNAKWTVNRHISSCLFSCSFSSIPCPMHFSFNTDGLPSSPSSHLTSIHQLQLIQIYPCGITSFKNYA